MTVSEERDEAPNGFSRETDVAPVDIFLFHNRCSNLTEFYDLVTV